MCQEIGMCFEKSSRGGNTVVVYVWILHNGYVFGGFSYFLGLSLPTSDIDLAL